MPSDSFGRCVQFKNRPILTDEAGHSLKLLPKYVLKHFGATLRICAAHLPCYGQMYWIRWLWWLPYPHGRGNLNLMNMKKSNIMSVSKRVMLPQPISHRRIFALLSLFNFNPYVVLRF